MCFNDGTYMRSWQGIVKLEARRASPIWSFFSPLFDIVGFSLYLFPIS